MTFCLGCNNTAPQAIGVGINKPGFYSADLHGVVYVIANSNVFVSPLDFWFYVRSRPVSNV